MDLDEWDAQGRHIQIGGDTIFVVDSPAVAPTGAPPLLVIHGFPTSSVDWAAVLPHLCANRRVILFDLPGFGLSSKHDRPYNITTSANAAQSLIEHLQLEEVDLVTHDMGDTVGGELLARHREGRLSCGFRRRVITNGSVYLDMAHLTDGQRLLWSAPDEVLPAEIAPTADTLALSLTDTLAPSAADPTQPRAGLAPVDEISAHMHLAAEALVHDGGARLLPRLIRYLSDRRDNEARYTGAVEDHAAPLGIVWGELDPISVVEIARHLAERTGAPLTELRGVGHYPMLEAPEAFARAVLAHLDA